MFATSGKVKVKILNYKKQAMRTWAKFLAVDDVYINQRNWVWSAGRKIMKKEETMMEITPCRDRGNSVSFSWCLFNCVWSPILWPSSWLVWRFKREFVCISLISWFWRNTFLSVSSSNSRFSGALSLKKFVILHVVSCVSTFSINHSSFKTTL